MYLVGLKRYNGQLNCVVTLHRERGRWPRPPRPTRRSRLANTAASLHGIPYGVKDIIAARRLSDHAGARRRSTTQTFDYDADRRRSACTTPARCWSRSWRPVRWRSAISGPAAAPTTRGISTEGSSGSSAGSGAATAAGLVGFAIGTDTGGSILSPAVRCGVVGLRPTFGRVSRYGVMAAGTTLDKIGPMCRHAQDCAIVLQRDRRARRSAICGARGVPFAWDARAPRIRRASATCPR